MEKCCCLVIVLCLILIKIEAVDKQTYYLPPAFGINAGLRQPGNVYTPNAPILHPALYQHQMNPYGYNVAGLAGGPPQQMDPIYPAAPYSSPASINPQYYYNGYNTGGPSAPWNSLNLIELNSRASHFGIRPPSMLYYDNDIYNRRYIDSVFFQLAERSRYDHYKDHLQSQKKMDPFLPKEILE